VAAILQSVCRRAPRLGSRDQTAELICEDPEDYLVSRVEAVKAQSLVAYKNLMNWRNTSSWQRL